MLILKPATRYMLSSLLLVLLSCIVERLFLMVSRVVHHFVGSVCATLALTLALSTFNIAIVGAIVTVVRLLGVAVLVLSFWVLASPLISVLTASGVLPLTTSTLAALHSGWLAATALTTVVKPAVLSVPFVLGAARISRCARATAIPWLASCVAALRTELLGHEADASV